LKKHNFTREMEFRRD